MCNTIINATTLLTNPPPSHGCEILHEEDFFVISQHINHSTLCTDVLSVPPSNLCHSQSTNYHLAIMMT